MIFFLAMTPALIVAAARSQGIEILENTRGDSLLLLMLGLALVLISMLVQGLTNRSSGDAAESEEFLNRPLQSSFPKSEPAGAPANE